MIQIMKYVLNADIRRRQPNPILRQESTFDPHTAEEVTVL